MARKALCIGINDYPGDDEDLRGCVNDARAWADLLVEHFSFARGDVTVLLDRDATKANMVAALKRLLAGAKAGDVLVFTNSSHGSYEVDTSGDESYDEAICPVDCDTKGLLLDDELRKLFAGLAAGVSLSVIADCCHSGSLTRAAEEAAAAQGYRRARFLSPKKLGKPELAGIETAAPRRLSEYKQSDMKELLLSGCTSREFSWDADIGGKPHGALTYYTIKAIRDASYRITWEDLHKRVRSLLDAARFDQHPQLEGRPERKKKQIFS
jgi:uncharacterized caspase-like protein